MSRTGCVGVVLAVVAVELFWNTFELSCCEAVVVLWVGIVLHNVELSRLVEILAASLSLGIL